MKWDLIIIPVVPVILAIMKQLIPKIPKMWIPIAAAVIGALAELAMGYSGIPGWGAILGMAGVGLREIVDQIRKSREAN
jgi:uncharacterized RDD family membrane protein YckC